MAIYDNIKWEIRQAVYTKSPKLKWKILYKKMVEKYGGTFIEPMCLHFQRFPSCIQEEEYEELVSAYKQILESLKRDHCEYYEPSTHSTCSFCNKRNRYAFCNGNKKNCYYKK